MSTKKAIKEVKQRVQRSLRLGLRHRDVLELVGQEIRQINFEELPRFTEGDIFRRVRKKGCDVHDETLRLIIHLVLCENYGWDGEELTARLELDYEAKKRHAKFLHKTQGITVALAFLKRAAEKSHREAERLFREMELIGKDIELSRKYRVERMSEWPRAAWEEYTEFAVGLGYRREAILKHWPRSLLAQGVQ